MTPLLTTLLVFGSLMGLLTWYVVTHPEESESDKK